MVGREGSLSWRRLRNLRWREYWDDWLGMALEIWRRVYRMGLDFGAKRGARTCYADMGIDTIIDEDL